MHHPMQGAAAHAAPPGERWLTVDEMADHMQLTPNTVRRLARNGTLPAVKVGRQFRFLVSQMLEKLEGGRVAHEKENPRAGGL